MPNEEHSQRSARISETISTNNTRKTLMSGWRNGEKDNSDNSPMIKKEAASLH